MTTMHKTAKPGNYAMRDQFKKLNIQPKKRIPLAHRTALTSWKGDGIDHINVSSRGKTKIGSFLAHDARYEVVSPKFGKFSTVRNLWLWLKTENRDDRLRDRIGRSATALYSSLRHREVNNFRAIILDTDWQKLKQYPDAAQALKNSTHPLDMYFYPDESEGTLPRRPNTFHWLVEGWEELRQALREDREPDLSAFLDVPGTGIYDFAFGENGEMPAIMEKPVLPKRQRRFGTNTQKQHHPRNSIEAVKNSVIDLTSTNESIDATKDGSLKDIVHVTALEPVIEETPVQAMEPLKVINNEEDIVVAHTETANAIQAGTATVTELTTATTEEVKDVITAAVENAATEGAPVSAMAAALATAIKS